MSLLVEPVYRPVIGIALGLFKTLNWRVITSGAEYIPAQGPAVIASNHVGYLDFVFIGYAAREQKRLVRFLAKKEVFDHKISGPLMRGMKHIPVDRFGRANASIESSAEAMGRGEVIGMFPESTISRSFVPRPGKTGAARMAMMASAPIVPAAVWGSQRILTKDRPKNFQRNVVITVDLGPPIPYLPTDDPAEVTGRLMEAIGKLVDVAQQNYPQQPEGEDDRWWLPRHLGGSAPSVEEADAMAARDSAERRQRRERES